MEEFLITQKEIDNPGLDIFGHRADPYALMPFWPLVLCDSLIAELESELETERTLTNHG
jgi:hypothetical protein